ncbi:MAG: LPS-assembly protein LptD [Bacteroidales bacterium]|jgi:hypothetical protein|nr:LPS-assembly protein LptD [Bacteroidales bacterium]
MRKDISGRDSLAIKNKDKDTVENLASIDEPVFSEARDSSVEIFTKGARMKYFYGDVTVKYNDMQIKADYIAYDAQSRTVFAKGLPDSSGKVSGNPVMTEGGKKYEMESVYYNFDSRKAKIKNMITQEGDGYLHGTYIKKMPDNSINVAKGIYTTCDLEHPHYYIKMSAAKVVTSQSGDKKTVFGPAYLVVEDVPTPFALPFGFVPSFGKRNSGILVPTYGEENARGFYMKDFGYYFVFGDHWDLAVTGTRYSLGSWAVALNSRYNVRYKYNGNFNLDYSVDQTGEKGQPDFFQTKNFGLQWSHSQDSKARPGTSFRASVNFSSPSYNKYNSNTISQALSNQVSSSVSYGRVWAGTPFSLTVNALHSQNSRDSSYSVTFPNITFTMARIYPFKRKHSAGKKKFYESFGINYTASFVNKINFKSDEVHEPDFFKKLKNGLKNNFSFNLPTFTLLKYIQAAPGISYGMNMYFSKATQHYDQQEQKVVITESDPFSTFGVTQTFSGSLSLSTRLYGLFNFGPHSRILAIRHMITPSITFSGQPQMATRGNGFRTFNYVDVNGIQHVQDYNIYSGQVNSVPGRGESASMGFSLGNNVEAKVRDKRDTTGKGYKKVKLIDQLSIGGTYNFLADSMKLSTISVNMSTTVFGKMAISANATLDPYAIDERGHRYNEFNIAKEGGLKLFRMTHAGFSTSYSFNGEGTSSLGSDYSPASGWITAPGNKSVSGKNDSQQQYKRIYTNPYTGEYIPGGWVYYMPPTVPWSVNLNFSYTFSKSYQYSNDQLLTKNTNTMTLGISSQIKLTDKLNCNLNTGFDLSKMKMTTTQFSANMDLHCFNIAVSWIPNGQWESWSFRISAKASALADLLQYKKNASYWDKY